MLDFKIKSQDRCKFVKLILIANKKTMFSSSGWILKPHGKDATIRYGQIFSKQIKFTQASSTVTIKALIHDVL